MINPLRNVGKDFFSDFFNMVMNLTEDSMIYNKPKKDAPIALCMKQNRGFLRLKIIPLDCWRNCSKYYTANIYSRCTAKVLPKSCTVTWNTANDCAQCLAVPFYSQVTATIQLMTVNQTVIDIPVITHANDCNWTVWKWLLVYYTAFDCN